MYRLDGYFLARFYDPGIQAIFSTLRYWYRPVDYFIYKIT